MLKGGTIYRPINFAFAFTCFIIITSVLLPPFFQDEIYGFGTFLLEKYGQNKVDLIVFFLSAISSTPLALPVWTYAVYGSTMGYNPLRLVVVVSLGSTLGSFVTYLIGRYFCNTSLVKRKFPDLQSHSWTNGKSLWIVSMLLFVGTAAPIPIDVMYAACGLKRYLVFLFWLFVFSGKINTYSLLVSGWKFIQDSGLSIFVLNR